jgi:hypothetical protein
MTYAAFHDVATWWVSSPRWREFIYFAGGTAIALFTDRVRRILMVPVRYPAKGLVWMMERNMKRQIEILRFIGDSPFKLTNYIAYYCADSLISTVGTASILWFLMVAFATSRHVTPPGSVFLSMFLVPLFVRMQKLKNLLAQLFDPEKSIQQLEDLMGKHTTKS